MNTENLLKAADYIEKIPQEKFDMEDFREEADFRSIKCNSVGCIVGHCTMLDTEENIDKYRKHPSGDIKFGKWSDDFFGLTDDEHDHWLWLFGDKWIFVDNTPAGAAARIRDYVENGLPENWMQQMRGKEPLSYK